MDIKTKVISGLRWSVSARFAGQLFNWAVTIIVIRLLNPADYGLMAMATVFSAFLYLFNTLGLDAILVQKKDLQEIDRRRVFGAVIMTNLIIFFGLMVSAPFIADFFGESRLISIIRIEALSFLIAIFETLPIAKLERDIAFKHRSIVEFCSMLISSTSTLVLAYHGYGVWALVYGSLIYSASNTFGLNIIAPSWCLPSFSITKLSKDLHLVAL